MNGKFSWPLITQERKAEKELCGLPSHLLEQKVNYPLIPIISANFSGFLTMWMVRRRLMMALTQDAFGSFLANLKCIICP